MDRLKHLFRSMGAKSEWRHREKRVVGWSVIRPMETTDRQKQRVFDLREGTVVPQRYLFYGGKDFIGMRRGDTVRDEGAEYNVLWAKVDNSLLGCYVRACIRKKEGGKGIDL